MPTGKAVILGATGPVGKSLARELLAAGAGVRVVARSKDRLAAAFPQEALDKVQADLLNASEARTAVQDCDVAFDCMGAPMARIGDHVPAARNIAALMRETPIRVVQVSSFWAYLPVRELPLGETHPREGGVFAVRARREAEDILRAAGAAIVNLPDFYGPEVSVSTLQQALAEAVAGKTANWIGSPDSEREYVFVPDAARAIVELARHDAAYGERWIVPGAGPIAFTRIVSMLESKPGHALKVRGAGKWALGLISLLVPDLRPFMPMVPYYVGPMRYDGSKLRRLLGSVPVTPYHEGISRTVDWLRLRQAPSRA